MNPTMNPPLTATAAPPKEPTKPRRHSALYEWLATTEHTAIGRRFIGTAMVFFVLGGGLVISCSRLRILRSMPSGA